MTVALIILCLSCSTTVLSLLLWEGHSKLLKSRIKELENQNKLLKELYDRQGVSDK